MKVIRKPGVKAAWSTVKVFNNGETEEQKIVGEEGARGYRHVNRESKPRCKSESARSISSSEPMRIVREGGNVPFMYEGGAATFLKEGMEIILMEAEPQQF